MPVQPASVDAPVAKSPRMPGRLSLVVLGSIGLACLVGPWLLPFAPEATDWEWLSTPPAMGNGHWLGTDAIGRDVLARVLAGGRVSLMVGFCAAALALLLGLVYGAIAGYAGGRLERAMMRALDVLAALPFLLIVVLLLALFERSLPLLLGAVGFAIWTDFARVVRGEAARLREAPFVVAAVAMGATPAWVLTRRVLPQLLPLSAVWLGLLLPQAILVESFLGFLGLSIDEPAVGWGGLLAEGVQEMLDAPWVLCVPAVALCATLLAATRASDALRDRLDLRRAGR